MMIDQSLVGFQLGAPIAPSYRDQPVADDGPQGGGKDFESFVADSAAKPANARNSGTEGEADQKAATTVADKPAPTEPAEAPPANATTQDAARKSALDMIESRLRLAAMKQVQKSATTTPEIAISEDALKQKVKAKQGADIDVPTAEKTVKAEKAALSPTEALSLLLGISDKKGAEEEAPAEKGEAVNSDGLTDPGLLSLVASSADKDARVASLDAAFVATPTTVTADGGKDAGKDEKSQNRASNAEGKGKVEDDLSIKLVSADGKGRPVDITLPKPTSEAQVDGEKRQPAAAKVETVTVVEARRYLGLADGSNAGNLAAAVKADPAWSEALSRATAVDHKLAGDTITEVNTLKLQMNPENLGNMTASLTLKGEELSVAVRVETIDAYRQLSADQDGLVKALQDQGFSIDQVTVQLSPSAATDGGSDLDSQSQQNAPTREEQREAGERDRGDRRSTNEDARRPHEQTTRNSTADSRNSTTRDGDIYL